MFVLADRLPQRDAVVERVRGTPLVGVQVDVVEDLSALRVRDAQSRFDLQRTARQTP
jgi:hypothetical protein